MSGFGTIANRDPDTDVADFYAGLTVELARFRNFIAGYRRCNHHIGHFTCAEAPPNLRSSGVIYSDRVASLLAEGVCGYDKSQLYCTCAKHVDFCRECRKGKHKRHERDKQPVPHCVHLAAAEEKGSVGNGHLGYINAATSRKGYYPMSAFGGKADIKRTSLNVRF
jgi:hypothetical protein